MSKIEKGKLRLREQLEAMSKGENAKTTRVLRDDELDFVSGGKYYLESAWPSAVSISG
jgi:hypothetical protein